MNIQLKILNKEFYKTGFKSRGDEDLDEYIMDLPVYATTGSAAMDLRITKDVILRPKDSQLIGTGLAISMNIGRDRAQYNLAALVIPRSGLGNQGIILGNGVGLIDEDYQGEIKLNLWNRTSKVISLPAGIRAAQLLFIPILKAQWEVVKEFSYTTSRGEGGFGSTGG